MQQKFIGLLITVLINTAYLQSLDILPSSDNDIFIYGTIHMEDGETYTGQIRWGKEEAFWFDHFNSSKPTNENLKYLSRKEERALNGHSEGVVIKGLFGWNNHNSNTHSFACQFGNIKSIEMGRRDEIELELKNGIVLELEGGSNDINTDIQITDEEIGHIKLDWDRIEKVEFSPAPSSFESHYGAPLYGTVITESGESFEGYVQWDHDERLAFDLLNGENRDGDIDLEFGKISKIERSFRGSVVTLHSGRTLNLRGTNDVNNGNRGIIVNMLSIGRVDIPWDEFVEVTFSEPKSGTVHYNSFDGDQEITGSVTTSEGEIFSGTIIYDLDEEYQLEILNGDKNDIEYFIPFQLVKSIQPRRSSRANVELKSGTTIRLEDSVDVSEDHDGVLIFENDDDNPVYIPWYDIENIQLN